MKVRASGDVADYTFNMLGNRVKKVTNTDTIKMFYDGYDCVADYDNSITPALLRYYITPNLDENLLVYDEETTDEEYFYIHDGLGTVRQILDDTQNVENQYDYEGFGTSLSSTENIYNRFRYTGREYDKETESDPTVGGGAGTNDGLYYYRARTYDSSAGSFTSRDPIPAANLYPYCSSNPIKYIDSMGLIFVDASGESNRIVSEYKRQKAYIDTMVSYYGAIPGIKVGTRQMLNILSNYSIIIKGLGSRIAERSVTASYLNLIDLYADYTVDGVTTIQGMPHLTLLDEYVHAALPECCIKSTKATDHAIKDTIDKYATIMQKLNLLIQNADLLSQVESKEPINVAKVNAIKANSKSIRNTINPLISQLVSHINMALTNGSDWASIEKCLGIYLDFDLLDDLLEKHNGKNIKNFPKPQKNPNTMPYSLPDTVPEIPKQSSKIC